MVFQRGEKAPHISGAHVNELRVGCLTDLKKWRSVGNHQGLDLFLQWKILGLKLCGLSLQSAGNKCEIAPEEAVREEKIGWKRTNSHRFLSMKPFHRIIESLVGKLL